MCYCIWCTALVLLDVVCSGCGALRCRMRASSHREQSVKTEKTKKMQQSDIYYQLLSQHVSGIIMPIFSRTKTALLYLVYCSGSAGCGW